ncbi:uncharacterized protein LOC119840865 [Zerene cesonia]|uniref:uncharacterized protein LOC119840865 n=1 Tax=Zerene cesonia TaxID=33412 RepID=UPI0018E4F378|nr:uncharacterized protein LOC119840865 [Zerene cesonia]
MASVKRTWSYLCILILSVNFVNPLEAPTGVKVTFLEPSGLYVEWDQVPYDSHDPITGYIVKLWAIKEETTRNYKLINGEQYPGLEKNDYAAEPFTPDHFSQQNVSEITIRRNNVNYARINYVSPMKLYEVRVMAYKGDEVGPMSEPRRLKFIYKTNFVLLAQRTLDSCQATIITNKTSSDGSETFVYNTYL